MASKVKEQKNLQNDSQQNEQLDVPEQVESLIKQLPTLKDKVQAIAINNYQIKIRNQAKQIQLDVQIMTNKLRGNYRPQVDDINSIVSGTYTFTQTDFEDIDDLLTEQQRANKHSYYNNQPMPQYWLKVLKSSPQVGQHIQQHDEPVLKHLQKLQAGRSEDLKTLWVAFYFTQNQWFNNEKLYREFTLQKDQVKKSSGTLIEWKQGKNLTIKIVKKKKKKGNEQKTKQVKNKTFFNFFTDIELDSDNQDQDQQDNNIDEIQLQFQMAQAVYEDLLPLSLQFYLNGPPEDDEDYQDEQQQEPPTKTKKK